MSDSATPAETPPPFAPLVPPVVPPPRPTAGVEWVGGGRTLQPSDLESDPPRRTKLPLLLFLATCGTTFLAGCYGWEPGFLDLRVFHLVDQNWHQGLHYMAAVMAVLLAHEMGHFLMALRYRVPASLPMFIPIPIMAMGTMGAVIGMAGSRADRRQTFDIGLAGPLAGLVVVLPLLYFGLQSATFSAPNQQGWHYGDPLLVKLLIPWLRPDVPAGWEPHLNPLLMAAWVGLLVTGLNMLPVSQLDGGHVAYALFGPHARLLGRLMLIGAIAFILITESYNWALMVVLVTLIGTDHPPTANDQVPIGPLRWIMGAASLLIPVFCFTPWPLYYVS
jgi:membrane-associated protease RseP (regulator of RpoE activity)